MSRAQQGNVLDQSTATSKNYNTNANTGFNTAQGDVNTYADAVAGLKAKNPFQQGGEAETAVNQQLADTASAGGQALGQAVQGAAVRTGQNPGGAIAATERIAEDNQRRLTGEQAGATESRIGSEAGYNQSVLGDTGNVETMQDQLANQQGALSQGALDTEEKAAQTPSFLDELGQGAIQAGVAFAGKCPVKGTMFLMDNGCELPVQCLIVGDSLAGIDGRPQVISKIEVVPQEILRVTTANGLVLRNSYTHTFILDDGGFALAVEALGEIVATRKGPSIIVSVEPDGMEDVFNVETNGSHSYRADGVWAYGVGHEESDKACDRWLEGIEGVTNVG